MTTEAEKALDARKRDLDQRDKDLKAQEAIAETARTALDQREKDLSAREAAHEAAAGELDQRTLALAAREAASETAAPVESASIEEEDLTPYPTQAQNDARAAGLYQTRDVAAK